MTIITPLTTDLTEGQKNLFAQGADMIITHHELSAGLWYKKTPAYKGASIGTIGGCKLTHSSEASQFISDCADYLHSQCGCKTVIGPMNGNTWLQHRLILKTDDKAPFLMEPMEPAYFYELFTSAGFSTLSQYSSSSIDLTKEQPSYQSLEARLKKASVSTRCIDAENPQADLHAIFDLSLISFANNFLYTPISRELFIEKYKTSLDKVDPELVILAERNQQVVGYIFCLPDLLAQGKQPAIIIKTLACLQQRPLAGLGTYLVAKAQEIAKAKGYTEAIHALQHENNSSHRISQRFEAHKFRRYALMAKQF